MGLFSIASLFIGGCSKHSNEEHGKEVSVIMKDINQVKEDHTAELMRIPGVVGVYVGQLDDRQPCIGIMVLKKTPELDKKLPKFLDGYPVRIDETGEIKPMR